MLNKPHYEENRITQEVYRMAKRCVAYGRVSTVGHGIWQEN